MRDGTTSTFQVDFSQHVKWVIKEITKNLRIDAYSETYGLVFTSGGDSAWLQENGTLAYQGVSDSKGTKVTLAKRFINRDEPVVEPDALDEEMAFYQCRYELLSGRYDEELWVEFQGHQAAILMLLAAPTAPFSAASLQEKSSSFVSPKWRKKVKGELSNQVSVAHASILKLQLDKRGLMKRFLQNMPNLPSFGSWKFELKTFRTNSGQELGNCSLRVSSANLAIYVKQNPDVPVYQIQTNSIKKASSNKSVVAISYTDASNNPAAATIACDSPASTLKECIAGCLFVAQQRSKKNAKKVASLSGEIPRAIRATASSDSILVGPPRPNLPAIIPDVRDFDAVISLTRDLLLAAEQEMTDLVSLRKHAQGGRRRSERSLVTVAPASIFFTQAASHLGAASRALPGLVLALKSPETFSGIELRRFETAISNWSSSICSISTCLSGGSDSIPGGIQTIAATTRSLISLAASFTYLISAVKASRGVDIDGLLASEISQAERALSAGCIAADLALQDLVADESTASSMMTCLRDIQCSSTELISETIDLLRSDSDSAPDNLKNEIAKARATFGWYRKMLACVCTVHCSSSPELSPFLDDAVEAIASSANSLLRLTMEFSSDQLGNTSLTDPRSRVRFQWSCLSQSLKTFVQLANSTATPHSDIDPMLPPVLNTVCRAVDDIFTSFASVSTKNVSQHVSDLATAAGVLVRTLANLVSMEPSPTILIQAARIEVAIERLRTSTAAVLKLAQASNSVASPARENPNTVARKHLVSGALSIEEAALITLSDIRGQAPESRERICVEVKLLVMTMLQFRSTLRAAASLYDSTEYTDSHNAQKCMDQLDALLHEILPVLELLSPLHSGGASGISSTDMESLVVECEQQFHSIADSMHSETGRLGIFTDIIVSQRQRFKTRLSVCKTFVVPALQSLSGSPSETMAFAPPPLSPATASPSSSSPSTPRDGLVQNRRRSVRASVSSADIMKRMSSRRKLLTRPEVKVSPIRMISMPAVQEDAADIAVKETGSSGELEVVNEAGLLEMLDQIIQLAEPTKFHLSQKDALELCCTTYPYWTSAASVVAVITSAYVLLSFPLQSPCSPRIGQIFERERL